MFRRFLSRNLGRGAATGVLALTAVYGSGATLASFDSASHSTADVTISISTPLRKFLSLASDIFSPDVALPSFFTNNSPEFSTRLPSTTSPLPPSDSNKDAPCCAACLGRNSIAKAAAAAGPAVVNISVFHGLYGQIAARSIGSGTIIDPDGTILTCAHCVADLRSKRRVSDGRVCVQTDKFYEHAYPDYF